MPRTSRSSARHTPSVSTPASSRPHRSPSPLSPARKTRMEEKKEMQNLNDRLATYIERVRSQEIEIASLQQQVSTVEESRSTEVITMRNAYDHEIGSLRSALDDTSREKARFEINADKFEKEVRDLNARLKEKEKALESSQKEVKILQTQHTSMLSDLDLAKSELNELRPEKARLVKQVADAKRNLEEETLRRIDVQNQLQTSQEGLKFENSLLEQQLNETKTRKAIEISEIDGKLHEKYEEKLQKSLAELRETYEKQLSDNREEFGQVYDDKMRKLQEKLDQERIASSSNTQEIREMETRVSGLTSRNLELESSNAALQKRLSELVDQMELAAKNFRSDMARKDAEVRSKEEQMEEMLGDYQGLMEIKVALDMEIAAYRKLLEGEEARLGMSASGSQAASPAVTPAAGRGGRGIKRKRITEEEVTEMVSEHSGKGDLVVEPLEKDGKFIAVKNNTDQEINIGGWSLTNNDGNQDVTYKFHRTTTLQAGEVCHVWSADANQEHNPPLNLVMKRGGWQLGAQNTTTLANKSGEVEATRLSHQEKRLVGSLSYGTSQLYNQDGDPDGEAKNCVLM